MRVRAAQAVVPELHIAEHREDQEAAIFSQLIADLSDVAASIEVLRPGLVIFDSAAAGRFYGSEDRAAERAVDACTSHGIDVTIGIADELATAVIAARHNRLGMVVPPGRSREVLSGMGIGVLAAEPALGCDPEQVRQFRYLGISTLGELAALDSTQVVTRFGRLGARCHDIARARADRRVAPELERPDLAVMIRPAHMIQRVDEAAFAARDLAAQLHERLKSAGVVCLRLEIRAQLADGRELSRVWHTREALDEEGTANRVRWQLDGWLVSRAMGRDPAMGRDLAAGQEPAIGRELATGQKPAINRSGNGLMSALTAESLAKASDEEFADVDQGIVMLELVPLETANPEAISLWGHAPSDEQSRRVISRVQSQLGIDAVLVPYDGGGRGVAQRIRFSPYGETPEPVASGTWPGRIPSPLPVRLGAPGQVILIDESGHQVYVTAEVLLSSLPHILVAPAVIPPHNPVRSQVVGWAGPWPDPPVARLQLITAAQIAQGVADAARQTVSTDLFSAEASDSFGWLLAWQDGKWAVEATYF